MRLLARGWDVSLGELAASATRDLVVCSPYVGREGTELLSSQLTASFRRGGSLTFVTDLSPTNVCQGATDPWALRQLRDNTNSTAIRHLPRVHAKVYIADEDIAIIGSGNLTAGGLHRNFEYAIELRTDPIIGSIKRNVLEYAALGAEVRYEQLDAYCDAAQEVRNLFEKQNRSVRRDARQRFERALRNAEDNLLRVRLAGGPIHTVFARTIDYLLRTYGPQSTESLHPLIKSIHPDLCDDSVDRVIDGRRFGKKWKHAVRTAQQQLKKRGVVCYEHGSWRLV